MRGIGRKRMQNLVTAQRCARLRSVARGLAICVAVMTAMEHAAPVSAQPAPHTTCQGSGSESISLARTALQNSPDQLGPRLKLADALVDQGCYEEAVKILEAGQPLYPHDIELSGKLRDVRSMLTEQTYISGITQAADAAAEQHNQLRCTQLSDVEACNEALRSNPNDSSLLLAKADGLMQKDHAADATAAYKHALQLNPGNDSTRAKLAAAEARASATSSPAEAMIRETSEAASTPRASRRSHGALDRGEPVVSKTQVGSSVPTLSTPAVALNSHSAPATALASSAATPSYSNDAPVGRSN